MRKSFFLFIFSLFLVGCQQLNHNNQLLSDPNLKTGTLDNGLSYFLLKNNYPEDRVYIRLVINAGSMNEDDDQKGVAHIVEHMAFNGSKQYPQNTIINALEKLGMKFARDINAFTDFENTVYVLNLSKNDPETLALALNIINEWMNNLTILPDDLNSERGIVLEEWRSRLSPMLRLGDKKSQIELSGSRYALRDPIGDVNIIKHVSSTRVKDFYQKWYRPDNMSLIIVGDINVSSMQTLITQKLSDKSNRTLLPLEKIDYSIPIINHWRLGSVSEKEIYTPAIELSFFQKFNNKNTVEEYKQDLISQIAMRLINLRLQDWEKAHDETIQSANFYQDTLGKETLGKETLQKMFSLQLHRPNYRQSLELLFGFIAELNQQGFTEQELIEEKKRLTKLNQNHLDIRLGSLKIANDLVTFAANNQVFLSEKQKYGLNDKMLSEITLADINQYIRNVISIPAKLLLITQPNNNDKLNLTVANVESLWNQKMSEPQHFQTIKKSIVSLPALNLTEGKIITHKSWKNENIDEYQLSNGSRLIYYYTNKKPNQVYFKAVTSGGLRAIPKQEYHWLRSSTSLVDETGVGILSQEDFNQLFSQKPIVLTSVIDDYKQGFSGVGKTEFIEDIFKLLHLKLQNSPISEKVLDKYKRENAEYLNKLDISEKFSRHVDQLRYPNQETNYGLQKNILARFDTKKLSDIYQKYFLGKTDFTYYIVGDIDKKTVEDLAKKYLANIEYKSTALSITPAKAITPHHYKKKGLEEPRSEVSFYFVSDQNWNVENNYLLDILGDIIQEQLRLDLREKESGIYSVSSWFSQDKYANQIEGRIEFSCDPHRTDELIRAANRIFDKIVHDGVPNELLLKKISEYQNELKQELDSPLVVLDILEQSFDELNNPDLIYMPKYLPHLATKQHIDKLAKKLLERKNRFEAILTQ